MNDMFLLRAWLRESTLPHGRKSTSWLALRHLFLSSVLCVSLMLTRYVVLLCVHRRPQSDVTNGFLPFGKIILPMKDLKEQSLANTVA